MTFFRTCFNLHKTVSEQRRRKVLTDLNMTHPKTQMYNISALYIPAGQVKSRPMPNITYWRATPLNEPFGNRICRIINECLSIMLKWKKQNKFVFTRCLAQPITISGHLGWTGTYSDCVPFSFTTSGLDSAQVFYIYKIYCRVFFQCTRFRYCNVKSIRQNKIVILPIRISTCGIENNTSKSVLYFPQYNSWGMCKLS